MPTISIIVPVYNVEQYLHKCIDSILAQTFSDFELILVNDGSTDNCGRICEIYSHKDNRIKVINKINGGISDARNAGLQIAEGEYIGFVDSDDWIEPNMYDELYKLSNDHSADISTCRINIWEKGKKKMSEASNNNIQIFDHKRAIHYMYEGKLSFGFPVWNKLYKRNLFDEIQFPKGRIYEDAAIMYKIFDRANYIVFIDVPLYNYIRRQGSTTRSSFSDKRFDVVLNYQEAYKYMEKKIPELCEILSCNYFASLRGMVVDIINEEESFINMNKNVFKVSKQIREINSRIIKNKIIKHRHKVYAQVLAWFPIIVTLGYRLRRGIKQ